MLDYVENSFLMTDPSTLSLSLTHISIYTEGEERGQDRRVSAKDKKEEFIKTALISWPNYRLNEDLVESIVGCGRIDQPPQLRLMYFCFVSLFPSVFLILLFFSFLLSLTCTLSFSVSRACMHRMSERERDAGRLYRSTRRIIFYSWAWLAFKDYEKLSRTSTAYHCTLIICRF